ncbi:MAG: Ppx/GppA phosphatase family protein, partial [Candidatus Phaeomarinobacter sp.]
MDDSHDTVRVAPASPGGAGQSPRIDAGVPGATRVEKQHSLPDGKATPGVRNPGDEAGAFGTQANQSSNGKPTNRNAEKAQRGGKDNHGKDSRRRGKNRNAQQRCYAAIDLGTNNCRLLIAKPSKSGFEVVDAFSRIVRLGEGLGTHNMLTEEAMDRAIAALRICASKMRRRNVVGARVVTTQACRHADNADVFMQRVAKETGLELEVLSPKDEAHLAVLGCAPLLDRKAKRALVFDIGGGSTELVWL